MPSQPPFVNPDTRKLEYSQIRSEMVPIGKLILLFVAASLVPFGLVGLAFGNSFVGAFLIVIGQFILAVGSGIVLMYIIVRAIQLSGD